MQCELASSGKVERVTVSSGTRSSPKLRKGRVGCKGIAFIGFTTPKMGLHSAHLKSVPALFFCAGFQKAVLPSGGWLELVDQIHMQ